MVDNYGLVDVDLSDPPIPAKHLNPDKIISIDQIIEAAAKEFTPGSNLEVICQRHTNRFFEYVLSDDSKFKEQFKLILTNGMQAIKASKPYAISAYIPALIKTPDSGTVESGIREDLGYQLRMRSFEHLYGLDPMSGEKFITDETNRTMSKKEVLWTHKTVENAEKGLVKQEQLLKNSGIREKYKIQLLEPLTTDLDQLLENGEPGSRFLKEELTIENAAAIKASRLKGMLSEFGTTATNYVQTTATYAKNALDKLKGKGGGRDSGS